MMFSIMGRAVAFACLATPVSVASAQVVQTPVESTFDVGLEGWALAPGQSATITHVGAGGAPGGYVRMTNGGSGRSDIEAPAAYLGDWSSLDEQGILQFDHKIFDLGGLPIGPPYYPYEVLLEGGGTNAARFISSETAQITWTTVTVPIHEQLWSVESGNWDSLLANVERVLIRIELVGNNTVPDDEDGIDNVKLFVDTTATAIDDGVWASPSQTALRSAYPNPFNPTVKLEFDLANGGRAQIAIYDAAGRLVRRLVDDVLPSARHAVVWNGRDDGGAPVASGVYFVRLVARDRASIKKIVLLK